MLSKRERMIAIVTGAVLALLALDQVILSPLLARLNDADARIHLAHQELIRAEQVFQNDLRARQRWNDMAAGTLRPDAPGAESQLLNRVRGWAQESGMTLTSQTPQQSEPEQDFQRITIRATGTGSMRQISEFLYLVQTADIPVRVSDLTLATRREGTDDLSLQVGLSTIYLPAQPDSETEASR